MTTSTFRLTYSQRADTARAAVADHVKTLRSVVADPRDRRSLSRLVRSMDCAGWLAARRSDAPQRTLVALADPEGDALARATKIAAQHLYGAHRHEMHRALLVAGDSPSCFDRLMVSEAWWHDPPSDPFPDRRVVGGSPEHLSLSALTAHVVLRISDPLRPGRIDPRYAHVSTEDFVTRCLSRLDPAFRTCGQRRKESAPALGPTRFRDVASRVDAWRAVPSPATARRVSREKVVAA